jgi:hypothetical protein
MIDLGEPASRSSSRLPVRVRCVPVPQARPQLAHGGMLDAWTHFVEGEERRLRAWDFVHCPPHTKHVLVGAGSGLCLVIAVGARAHDGEPDSLGFTADEVAKRHGASVEEDTTDGDVAYASLPPREPTAYRDGWLPE